MWGWGVARWQILGEKLKPRHLSPFKITWIISGRGVEELNLPK